MGGIMPGDPKECRERAARCLEFAASAANEGIKQTFLNIARQWQLLAEELERAKSILDDEKGTLQFSRKKRRAQRSGTGKNKRIKKSTGILRTKRENGENWWGHS
jgi:hypothetical protein